MSILKKINFLPLLWFILGFSIFIFTRTTSFIPIAIFISPVFILKFLRTQKPVKGILLSITGFILSFQIALPGPYIVDVGNVFINLIIDLIKDLMLAIIFMFPYMADRFISNKLKGFLSTLVFPVSATSFYFLKSKFPPFDGIPLFFAYTQYGNLQLVQFMSIAGLWGLIFFISWFASFVNWIWENEFNWLKTRKGVGLYLSITVLILLYGGLRSSPYFYNYKNSDVKIASIVFKEKGYGIDKILDKRIFSDINSKIKKFDELVKLAVENGSKIVVFQEFSLVIPKNEEERMICELKKTAKDYNVYVCISYVSMPELLNVKHEKLFNYTILHDEEAGSNKALLIDNKGKVVVEYYKRHFAMGEEMWLEKGPGKISVVNTPYGRIGVVICRDMEFPDYMITAGRQKADIMFAPSYEDVKSLAVTYMQMLRAVENGFSFVRPCANGLSIAIDYNGRILSSMNSFTTTGEIMYADIPVKGTRTIYSFIGDLFAWLCIAGFGIFVLFVIIKKIIKGSINKTKQG